MKKTVNLQLNLPENGDFFNVEHGNQNAVTLDGAVAGLQSGMAGQDQVISGMKTEISGKADQAALAEHTAKASAHVSDAERAKWNKAPVDLTSHTGNTTAHITDAERSKWNAKQDKMAVDSALSTTSLNPVQNKVITAKVNEINSNLSDVSQDLNGTVFIREGSGADTKYYIQTGADAASKKELGKGTPHKVNYFATQKNGQYANQTFKHTVTKNCLCAISASIAPQDTFLTNNDWGIAIMLDGVRQNADSLVFAQRGAMITGIFSANKGQNVSLIFSSNISGNFHTYLALVYEIY